MRRGVLIASLSGWTLWHDVVIYHAAGHTRLGGTTYSATAYETESGCHAGLREAMANELPRRGARTERIADGVKVWDENSRQHYTTFRYRCELSGSRTP
jgi:hypothetical protein